MRRLRIQHLTDYRFTTPVSLNQHRLLLRPREGHDVRIESSRLSISPSFTIQWQRDVFDNSLGVVDFHHPSDRLTVESDVVIQHYEPPFDTRREDVSLPYPFAYAADEQVDLAVFQKPNFFQDQDLVQGWLQQQGLSGWQTFDLLVRINRAICLQFSYQAREEPGVQSPALTLARRSGSCRDYATLFMEACRRLGMASRFVSGYLHAPSTEAGNATTHAWVEVYLPGTGWKGFDPTLGEVIGNRHIAVAVARDPRTVPPVAGSFLAPGGVASTMTVNVQVNLLP